MMRYETFCSLLVSLQLLLLLPIAVSAERRTALVIGNSAYEIDPLRPPVNDAINMASKLRWLGFQVTLLQDMELQAMYKAVEAFSLDLRKGGVGLFYFAGHGVQSNGENYLFPVRAHVNREQDLPHEAMPVGRILASLEEAKNDVNIVILDACRDNPFARQWHSSQRGLAVTQAPRGFLIAYVTSPGAVVSDGQDRHGLYTTHLSQAMAIPGLSLEETFKKVRAAVSEATGGMQIPWESSSLTADFYFSPQQQTEVQEDRKHREKMAASPSAQIPLAVPPPVAVPPPARIPEAQQQTEAQPLASTPTVTIQRYLTMEAPEEVIPDQEFAIQVAFTMEQLTPQARVISGPKTDKGQLNLSLPAQDSWKIDVVMSAPGFTFRDGMNTSALVLPRQGDSTPVVFYLRAKPYYWGRAKQLRGSRAKPFRGSRVKSLRGGRQVGHLYATLWYQGAYLAKVVRAVRIVAPAHVARRTGAAPSHSPSSPSTPPMGAPTQPGQPLALHLGGPPPDL